MPSESSGGLDSVKHKGKIEPDRSHKSHDSLLKYLLKDACYFQMKSINHENVALSKSLGVWSTPIQNELRLNTAFREHRNVILIFSVQQSGCFQGFARMVSESGPMSEPVPWVLPARLSKKSLGGVFKVEWLCTRELPFHETHDLYNAFNDNKPIKVARDGQQVEAKVGKKLCRLFPRDSKRRLLEAVSTLKKQLSHRKKFPIQVPDDKFHDHREAQASLAPPMHCQNHMPNYYPSHFNNISGYTDPAPPYMGPYHNRTTHHHGYYPPMGPPYYDQYPPHYPHDPAPHYFQGAQRYDYRGHAYHHGPYQRRPGRHHF